MTRIERGERIGRAHALRLGAAVALFDGARERLLLTRRGDNGQWCLPGGGMDPGEGIAEAAERETLEETGLRVRAGRLVGVYSSPHEIVAYPDGNRFQIVALLFEAERVGGEPRATDEAPEHGFFTLEACEALDLLESHRQRIRDAFAFRGEAFVR